MDAAVILIVDDVPENLRLLSAILKAAGYRVRLVASGEVAMESVRQTPPDLILLDIRLPGADGFAVCRQLKQLDGVRDIPVIFISAMEGTEEKLKAFQAGGVDYVTKPFQAEEVLARVQTHLEIRRQKIQIEVNLRQLEKLERMRDDLTHMIVHDLRSPIMAVDGYHEMLQRAEGANFSPKGVRHLGAARAGIARLIRMTNEMLLVSKLEAVKMPLQLAVFDLTALIREVADEHRLMGGRKTIEFLPPPGAQEIQADREIIRRVLQNLLGNALDFSPEAGVVRLSTTGVARTVRVNVADEGPGLGANAPADIFNKFGATSENSRRPGIGLGLAFCKLAVEAHGGCIGVDSQLGKGSVFWFSLNRAPTDLPAAAE
jgi:signal transduction histidine kinase